MYATLMYATLDENNSIVPTNDHVLWAAWIEQNQERRRVAESYIGEIRVSTVFIGIAYANLWFESMAFDFRGRDMRMNRYSTWDAAAEGHEAMVAQLRAEAEAAYKSIGR